MNALGNLSCLPWSEQVEAVFGSETCGRICAQSAPPSPGGEGRVRAGSLRRRQEAHFYRPAPAQGFAPWSATRRGHPPHPGSLPPLGRAERESASACQVIRSLVVRAATVVAKKPRCAPTSDFELPTFP
jgi:hypothetical protein